LETVPNFHIKKSLKDELLRERIQYLRLHLIKRGNFWKKYDQIPLPSFLFLLQAFNEKITIKNSVSLQILYRVKNKEYLIV